MTIDKVHEYIAETTFSVNLDGTTYSQYTEVQKKHIELSVRVLLVSILQSAREKKTARHDVLHVIKCNHELRRNYSSLLAYG